jgi:predicted alpha/beta-hydrolase family hydrolase
LPPRGRIPRSRGELDVEGRPFSWIREGALDGRPLVLLAHGSSAPYSHPFVAGAASGLVDRGFAVVRFHFPFMERIVREERRRPPDRAPVLLAAWRAMVARGRRFRGAGPLVLAGKSLGARMASMLLAEGGAPDARAAVWLGYPLHPAGKPDRLRADHLPDVSVPQLFVQGERDPLCDLALLSPVLKKLGPRARLHVVARGDHSLARSRREPMADAGEWLDAAASFLRDVL